VYVFANVTTAVRGDDSEFLPKSRHFQLTGPDFETGYADVEDVSMGERYTTGLEQVSPGTTNTGWIPFLAPDEILPDLQLRLDRDGEGTDALWNVSSAPSLADPRITNVSVPENATLFSDFNASLTVENRGEGSGPVRGLVSITGEDDLAPDSVTRFNDTVESGETKTVKLNLPQPGTEKDPDETFNVVITGTGESRERTVQVVLRTLDLGETYTTPGDLGVTVKEIVLGDTLETKAIMGDGWTEHKRDESQQWAFVRISSTNHGEEQPLASLSRFNIRSADLNEEPPIQFPSALAEESEDFRGSVSGTTYVPPESAQTGESTEGWIIFEVPASLARESIRVQWEASTSRPDWNDLRAAAYWDV
jgi:hypothetical protein